MEMKNVMSGMFGSVKSGLCRLTVDGNIAVKVGTEYKTYNPVQKTFVNCDSFVFDIGDEMFFVVPTNAIVAGDIILVNKEPRYVLDVKDDIITAINYKSGTIENIMPERHMFMGSTYFYGKIVSLFGNMGGIGGDGANNVLKYMMMSQMMKGMNGGETSGMNPMMLMMMMNGGGFGKMFDGLFTATAPDLPATKGGES
jgi:hypothetical protein